MDAPISDELRIYLRRYVDLRREVGRCVTACFACECEHSMQVMVSRLEMPDRLGLILDVLSQVLGRRDLITLEFRQWRRELTDISKRWFATVQLTRRPGQVQRDSIRIAAQIEIAKAWVERLRWVAMTHPRAGDRSRLDRMSNSPTLEKACTEEQYDNYVCQQFDKGQEDIRAGVEFRDALVS